MASKIYFKNKHSDRLCFSSDIFKGPYGKVSVLEPPKLAPNSSSSICIRSYTNIH